jgi:hypothetical protein
MMMSFWWRQKTIKGEIADENHIVMLISIFRRIFQAVGTPAI